MSTIYGLTYDGEIRYVGKTTQSLAARVRYHIARARRNDMPHLHVTRWIRSVQFDVDVVVLECDPVGGLDEAERAWIATLRQYGCRLTNLTDGGDGRAGNGRAPGFHHSAITRARQRRAALGRKHTPEARAKMSAAGKGKAKSLEHRTKIGLAHVGMKRSLETRVRISVSKTKHGRYSKYAGRSTE